MKIADNVLAEVEEMDGRQRLAIHKELERIRLDTETESIEEHTKWLDISIIPVLKEFAEMTFSVLEVERGDIGILVTTLRNPYSIDITEGCKSMYMALFMASYIAVDKDDNGNAILVLTYDCRRLLN